MGSFLIWLSGARPDILELSDVDRAKYSGMGSAVLITATMAGISMEFALHSALRAPLPAAIILAFAWGLAIMSLDRWLVASLTRQRNHLGYLVLALPRLGLGILFGLIISTPFTLQIFAPEIRQQIETTHLQTVEATDKSITSGIVAQQLAYYSTKVASDAQIMATRGASPPAPAIENLQKQLANENKLVNAAYKRWQCQLYGGSPQCPRGNGPLAIAAHDEYVSYRDKAVSINRQITVDERSRVPGAKTDFAPSTERYNYFRNEEKALEDATSSSILNNSGLLAQLHGLDEVTAGDGTLQAARWLLFLFFTAIECLPALIKVLLNLGPENTYEKLLARTEQEILEQAERKIPEIVQETIEERLHGIRTKHTRWKQLETVDVSHNGLAGQGWSGYRHDRL
jgi:hypothetical protein